MRRIALVSLIALFPLGCSDKEPAKPAAPTATAPAPAPATAPAAPANPAAPAAPANPQDPAAAMNQMAKMLGGAMGGANDPNAKTVNWRDLAPLLADDLAGWKGTATATGESTAMGAFKVTEVKRDYTKDTASAHLKIVDTSMNQMMQAAFNMARMANVDASDHYTRGVDIAGSPGLEEWHQGKNGKVAVLVGGRFIVEASASNVPDTKSLMEMVNKLDLGKLAGAGK